MAEVETEANRQNPGVEQQPVVAPPPAEPVPDVEAIEALDPPPTGMAAVLPFILVGLGTLIIGVGVGFRLRESRK